LGLALSAVLLLTFFLPIKFEISYKRFEQDDFLHIKLSIVKKIVFYELKLSKLNLSTNQLKSTLLKFSLQSESFFTGSTSHESQIKKPLQYCKDIYSYLKKSHSNIRFRIKPLKLLARLFFKTINCQEVFWSTELGLEDAALTAIGTGFLWNIKNKVYKNLRKNVRLRAEPPYFLVKPIFGKMCVNTNFKCIFDIRLGHIIITGIKLFILLVAFAIKGGDQAD